jgi:hypothetical protein
MILSVYSNYLPKQHRPTGLSDTNALSSCAVRTELLNIVWTSLGFKGFTVGNKKIHFHFCYSLRRTALSKHVLTKIRESYQYLRKFPCDFHSHFVTRVFTRGTVAFFRRLKDLHYKGYIYIYIYMKVGAKLCFLISH